MSPEERVAHLEGENSALRGQVRALLGLVQDLEALLAKDSHNSVEPPSSDGLARKTQSLRRRSGKKPGGQLGQCGETLRLLATPDVEVEHRPTTCPECRARSGRRAARAPPV